MAGPKTRAREALDWKVPITLPRLLAVSCTAFVGNQLMLAALLRFTPLPLWVALAIVLVFVALSTWLLGRYWAFAHSPA